MTPSTVAGAYRFPIHMLIRLAVILIACGASLGNSALLAGLRWRARTSPNAAPVNESLLAWTQRLAFKLKVIRRTGSHGGQRTTFEAVIGNLDVLKFNRTLRLSRETFFALLTLFGSYLRRFARGGNTLGGMVSPCARLALKLRVLAGGSYLGMTLIFRVHRSSVYIIFATLCMLYAPCLNIQIFPTSSAS